MDLFIYVGFAVVSIGLITGTRDRLAKVVIGTWVAPGMINAKNADSCTSGDGLVGSARVEAGVLSCVSRLIPQIEPT